MMAHLKLYRPCQARDESGNECGIQSVDGWNFCDHCLGELLHLLVEDDFGKPLT